jgi:hypothetical protein
MVLGSYKRNKWLKSAAGLKSFITNQNPKPRGVRERREAYPAGDILVGGGGTAGEVKEDHGVRGGRMRDGESEESKRGSGYSLGRKEGVNRGNVARGRGEKGVGRGEELDISVVGKKIRKLEGNLARSVIEHHSL